MKKIVILILILTATANIYPLSNFNARYLNLDIKYTLKKDGTQIFDYFHKVKLLNSTRGYGESFIKYNPEFQKLEVISSITTMADGTKVKSPDNGYNEILPREAKRFSSFSQLKEMVVSHTGIERGAEIELRYRIITKKGFIPYFTGIEFLKKDVPVDKYTLTIEIPKESNLNYKAYNYSIKPEVKISGESKIYIFKEENISPYRQNYYVKNYDKPYILFSNLKNLNGLFPEINNKYKICKTIENTISETKRKKLSKREILTTLKEKSVDTLENCHVNLKLSGFKVRSVKDILKSGYATSFEKVLVFKSLLDRLNIEYKMVSASPGFELSNHIFSYLQSERVAFVIKTAKEESYLDPMISGTDFNFYGNCIIPLVEIPTGKIFQFNNCKMEANSITLRGKVTLKNSKFKGNIRLYTSGSFFSYSEFIKSENRLYKRIIGKIFQLSKVKNIKILKVTQNFTELNGVIETKPVSWEYNSFLFFSNFKIPGIKKSMVSRSTIVNPITIGTPFVVKINLSVHIPDSYTVDMLKKSEKIDNSTGIYEYTAKIEKKGVINLYLKFGLKKGKIDKKNYPDLKQLIDSVLKGNFQIIIKKK